jgi:hypothetical protein
MDRKRRYVHALGPYGLTAPPFLHPSHIGDIKSSVDQRIVD